VAFIDSCTNGRLSDFQAVADLIQGHKFAVGVKAIAVHDSEKDGLQRFKPFTYEGFSKGGRIHPIVSFRDNKAWMSNLSCGCVRRLQVWRAS